MKMQTIWVSLLISVVCTLTFNMNCKNEDASKNQKLFSVFATTGVLSFFAQTLLLNQDPIVTSQTIEADVTKMMDHVQIGESPF